MSQFFVDVMTNTCIWSGFFAWMVAQSGKMLSHLALTRRVDFRYLASTGGMPSAHSAASTGFATAVGCQAGWGSPAFGLAVGMATLVVFDAATVRRAAGHQARILNEIVDEIFTDKHLPEQKLKELLGHTRLEVCLGMIIGVEVALIMNWLAAGYAG